MTLLALVVLLTAGAQVALLLGFATLLLLRRERSAIGARGGEPGRRPLDDLAASRHWWRRAEAARRSGDVARLGDRELLNRLLDDPHPAVQSAATASLAPLVDARLVGMLLDRLPERPMAIRLQQFGLLRDALPLTAATLMERLTLDAPPRRLKSWIALVETLGSPELLARVAALHSHPEPLIRLSVARALRHYRHPEAEEMLLIALHDHDWRVRAVAARSLGRHGNVSAVPRLAAGLRDVRWWVRFRCGLALAQLGAAGRGALDDARRDVDRYAGEMATMIAGLSPDSVIELSEG
ncbi:MAG: HEAT repeat domain-containing protein [Gemmatimonadaceae bacterium]|nr:HEAT repeat domain-containing protein [Gemmatimonadaceae bacterium]